ncbi:hypothetical protein [Mesorhizobium sp. CAU 1732]|uniref:hypothetical protein n=1 Tax=Mesorhizobium sp. CAU 1732 TaxID=3140358 RepID=UPI0032617F7C
MVDLNGEGLLALWNGVEPARTAEYNAWHTREHVPERISVPGIHGARRYVRLDGPLPQYLTLYPMQNLDVLQSAPYLRLLDHPTDWSRTMRPSLSDFMRLCCRRVLSLGGGMGSALAAITVGEATDLRADALHALMADLLRHDAFTAIHIIERDGSVPDVPFTVGGGTPEFPRGGAILFEGYDDAALAARLAHACDELARIGLDDPASTLTRYRLAYALDRASLDRVITIGPPFQ